MAVEIDAEEVVDLAFLQIGAGVDGGYAGDGFILGHTYVQADRAAAAPRAVEVVDDLKACVDVGAQFAAVALVVDASQVGEKVVALGVAQMAQDVEDFVGRDDVGGLGVFGPGALDGVCEFGA